MHSFYTRAQWTVATWKAETPTLTSEAGDKLCRGELHFRVAFPEKIELSQDTPLPKQASSPFRPLPTKSARPPPDPRRPREIKAMREVKPNLGSTFGNRTGDRGWAALATRQWNFAVN